MRTVLVTGLALLAAILLAPVQSSAEGQQPRRPSAQRQIVCAGATVPEGWIWVDDTRDASICGGDRPGMERAYNVWVIERVENRAPGTVIDVCAAAPTPSGWVLMDVFRSRMLCGHPDELYVANVKRIRRSR